MSFLFQLCHPALLSQSHKSGLGIAFGFPIKLLIILCTGQVLNKFLSIERMISVSCPFLEQYKPACEKLWFLFPLFHFGSTSLGCHGCVGAARNREKKKKGQRLLNGQIMPFNSSTFCWKGLLAQPGVVRVTLCREEGVGVCVVFTRVG